MILNLVTYIYPRAYLPKDQSLIDIMEKEIIIGGDREVQSFNSNELSILKNLLESPQIRMTSLAKNSSMNVKTAVSILKELNEKKVIRGFKSILSAAMMDVYRFRLFLKLHNLSQERSSQLMDFMMKTKEIGQLNKTVGDWDMEVDIESLDKARIRQITVQLRENFKDIIESFNIIEFYKYYKKSYLPKYLFE